MRGRVVLHVLDPERVAALSRVAEKPVDQVFKKAPSRDAAEQPGQAAQCSLASIRALQTENESGFDLIAAAAPAATLAPSPQREPDTWDGRGPASSEGARPRSWPGRTAEQTPRRRRPTRSPRLPWAEAMHGSFSVLRVSRHRVVAVDPDLEGVAASPQLEPAATRHFGLIEALPGLHRGVSLRKPPSRRRAAEAGRG